MPDGLKRLDPQEVTPVLLTALQTGAVIGPADVGVLAVSGPGAVQCIQGLLTNDIEKPGDDAFVYGALLTPKGMIVVDGWAARQGTTVTFTIPIHEQVSSEEQDPNHRKVASYEIGPWSFDY